MKNRLLVAFLLCVFLLGLASPAQAMPESKSTAPRIEINGQTLALAGETIPLEVRAWNESKGAQPISYRIVLPKTYVAAVSVIEGSKVRARHTAITWVFEWTDTMPKAKKSVAVLFSVTLAAKKTGTMPVMRIYQGHNIMVGLHKVTVSEPRLIFEAGMPESVIYGGRPFAYRLDAINKTQVPLSFDVRVDVYLSPATDGSSQYSANGGDVHDVHSFSPEGNPMNHTGMSYSWAGTLQPGERAKLEIFTHSGYTLGTHLGFVVTNILDGRSDEIGRYYIKIVKGTEPKYGKISLISASGPGQPLVAEQYAEIHLELFAPTLMQFIVSDISSTCPMAGLQNVIQSKNNLTWFEWSNILWIGGIEKPAGATDPYYATCTVSLKFHPWTNPGDVTEVSQNFQVLVP